MGKKKNNSENDIKLKFLGSSATGVTGSAIEVDVPFLESKWLIECGLCQEFNSLENYNTNRRIVSSVDIEKTLGVFCLHQHIDHIGNLCGIVHRGFNGKIYCTYEASKMIYHLLTDTVFLHEKECKVLSSKSKKKAEYIPYMTEQDVKKVMELIEVIDYDKTYELKEGKVKFRFLKNNHIVGSASLEMWIRKPNNSVKKIWYSSDLGSSICKNYYVEDLEISHNNNLSILESTYSNKESYSKQDRKNEIKLLENTIKEVVVQNKGNIIMPVFSMSRLQFMLTLLYEMMHDKDEFKDIPVIADTRLGMNISKEYKEVLTGKNLELFQSVMEWENLKQISNYQDTVTCSTEPTPKIVLSASGFLSSGTHATVYLRRWIGNKNNCIVFCGYSGDIGSLGYRVKDENTKTITLDNAVVKKNCKVISLHTFSSHIQECELLTLAKQIQTEKIILHHGNKDGKNKLKEKMTNALRECGKTTNVVVSEKDMEIIL